VIEHALSFGCGVSGLVVALAPAYSEDRCLGDGSIDEAGGQGGRLRRRVGGYSVMTGIPAGWEGTG